MDLLRCVLIGLVIGSVSGTLGIGGGVLLIPALILLFQFDYPKAAGTTLAVLAMPIGLMPAVWKYYDQGLIVWHDLKLALWIAAAFAVGAYTGASVVTYIPRGALQLSFGLLLLYVGSRFIINSDSEVTAATIGLCAAALGWLVYLALRILGERQLSKPDLGQEIRRAHGRRKDEPDYTI